jgi:hypothetical protein
MLYVIGMMLKNEINSISEVDDFHKFLDKTPCGYLLEQLRMKQDVQTFFENFISKTVIELEEKNSFFEINFVVDAINKDLMIDQKDKENEINMRKGKRKQNLRESYYRRSKEDDNYQLNEAKAKEFNLKYLLSLNRNEYLKLLEQYKNNEYLNEYLTSQSKLLDKYPSNYTNDLFFQHISSSKYSKEILASYQNDFMKTIQIIDDILNNLMNNLHLLPYSIKVICQMILTLVKKKFPNSTFLQQNSYISQFFFHKLFAQIFEGPDRNAFINKYILSKETKYNLKIISSIICHLFDGKLFCNGMNEEDFTPFNWFFIGKFETVCQFFKAAVNVIIPQSVFKLVNGELQEGDYFDYFKGRPDEKVIHKSICFTINDVITLINNMRNIKDFVNKEKTQELYKTFQKLICGTCQNALQDLKENIEYEIFQVVENKKKNEIKEIKGSPIRKYMLLTDMLPSPKYKRIFDLEINKANFHLPEVDPVKEEDFKNIKNNIISELKNNFCILLDNSRLLTIDNFMENNLNSITSILEQIKNSFKITKSVIIERNHSEWYIDSILDYIKILPPELTKDNCNLLLEKIEKGLEIAIKDLDFDSLSNLSAHVKYCKGQKDYFNKVKNSLIELQLNEKVQKIMEQYVINAEVRFNYDNKKRELKIEKTKKKNILQTVKDSLIIEEDSGKVYLSRNIKGFTRVFPNITRYQKDLKIMEKDLKLTTKINNYFKLIQESLTVKNNSLLSSNSQEVNEISTKIYDFIMEKIYDKIFPQEPDESDRKIERNCELFSWTEPRHFIKTKTVYIYDSFLPDVIKYFKEIEIQRSPRKKIYYMNLIFKSISNVVRFNGGKEVGVDDMIPILNYSFVKAKPSRMSSNCKYMELFIGEKINRVEGSQLAQLTAICKFAENITPDKLYGMAEKKFVKRCSTIEV